MGEEAPAQAQYFKAEQLAYGRGYTELSRPIVDGLVEDWDSLQQLWTYSTAHGLAIQPEEQPVLLVESVFNTVEKREKMCSLAFETLNVPAIFLANSAVLSA